GEGRDGGDGGGGYGPARPAPSGDSGPEAAVRLRLLGAADGRRVGPGARPAADARGGDPGERGPRRAGDAAPRPDDADRAYAAGDARGALAGYRRRLAEDPGDTDALVGVALAAGRLGRTAAARVLTTRPDLIRAVCHRLPGADPVAVAAWLADGPG
ncbi:hypothetical protein V6V16_20810, partial [Micromonospora sp. CPCC 205561]